MSGYEFESLPLTAFGDLRVAEITPVFQSSFEYTVDNTDITTNIVAGSGTVTQGSAMAVMSTGTTTGSTALLKSKSFARYRSGLGSVLRFSALFTTPVSGTEQYCGLADAVGSSAAFKNGYMIGYDGASFGFHRFQNDVKTSVTQSGWDDPLDGTGPSGITLDQTKLNVYFIQHQFLGAGAIRLFVEEQTTGDLILVHTIQYANLNTAPSTYNPSFQATFWADNGATTSNLTIKTASFGYFVEGKSLLQEMHQPQRSSEYRQKTAITTEAAIFTIRVKSTYASKDNFINILMERVVVAIEAAGANNLGSLRLIKNATIGGSPSYSDINTNNSVVEIDTSGTTVTGGTTSLIIPLAGKNDKAFENLVDYKIILQPGDTLTVAGTSVSSATINAETLWKELF